MNQYGSSMTARREFHHLSRWAMGAGLLTEAERDLLCRRGTRKARYWCKHLVNLRQVLGGRVKEQDGER